jgi:hypothetical protein
MVNSRKLIGTSRLRPAPSSEGTLPVLSVVALGLPDQGPGDGSMTLAIGWLHEAGDPPHPALRGGSMTLAIRWLHEGGETLETWLHEAGDWHTSQDTRRWTSRKAEMNLRSPGPLAVSLDDARA